MRDRRANHRIRVLLAGFGLLFAVAIARAAWVQAAQHDRYTKMAVTQHRETIEIPAGRGTIYDRTGEPLAIGEQATTVYADPRNVVDAQRAAFVAGKVLGLDAETLYPSLKDRTKGFVYVERKADPQKAATLSKRDIPGLGFYPEELRTYPQGRVAAHVLGFAGTDNHGLDGLERSLDKTLSGRPGYETIVKDPFGRAIDVVTSRPERPGRNVTLTIDHQIQANAEQILARTVRQFDARGAAAIVMDPRTGAILAMANYPTFDANHFATSSPDARRNRAVTDAYEPGSTFKIVTIAGALEDNVVTPRQHVHARSHDPGRRPRDPRGALARHRGDDRQGHPRPVVQHRHDHDRREARRGRARFVGRPVRVRQPDRDRLPGREPRPRAAAGGLVGLDDRHRADRAGHRRDAAADGLRLRDDRQRRRSRAPAPRREGREQRVRRSKGTRVVSRHTADRMMSMFRDVVLEGTGTQAAIPGYTVAGKTGTAQKAENGHYVSKYVASFVGLVPAKKPRLAILVMVDEPHGDIYGGVVAAPAFRDIARFDLQYLEVPPDAPETKASLSRWAPRRTSSALAGHSAAALPRIAPWTSTT